MFCDSLNDPDEKHPNVNVCPVCMGHPGTLPVINQKAVRKVILAGLAMNCSINKETFFERKNYFYPDLPKGYQISQFQKPFCYDGHLKINGKKIRIERIHLEEDAGRLYHLPGKDYTFVDFNRVGLPLLELVTEPDLDSAEDVKAFAQELQLILRYLGASDADIEKGQMRIEVNISLRPEGSDKLGTKVEIKNIGSISAAAKSVDYEIKRQADVLGDGDKIVQETRGWDDVRNKTVSQRTKEGSSDYRYFPEPDLPPMSFDDMYIDDVKSELPELPHQRRARFKEEYSLPEKDISVFVNNRKLGDYFEKTASEIISFDKLGHLEKPSDKHTDTLIKLTSNYTITELQKLLFDVSADPDDIKIKPESFADLIVRVFHKEISSSAAQTVLREMFSSGKSPKNIIKEKDLAQVSDKGELETSVQNIIIDNPKAVEDYKKGKEASIKFLVGKVMVATKGKGNPQIIEKILKQELGR
jgi:aspartyl-tRNA(Asn)/glutamyl-tRNA(Gln) amidotransferase subunit B